MEEQQPEQEAGRPVLPAIKTTRKFLEKCAMESISYRGTKHNPHTQRPTSVLPPPDVTPDKGDEGDEAQYDTVFSE